MTAATTTTYTAVPAFRRWWAISVPELRGVHTPARRPDEAAAVAREAIALMLDVDPSTISVEVSPQPSPDADRAV